MMLRAAGRPRPRAHQRAARARRARARRRAGAATAIGLLLRDSVAAGAPRGREGARQARRRRRGRAAPDLVGALGDVEAEVADEAASETLGRPRRARAGRADPRPRDGERGGRAAGRRADRQAAATRPAILIEAFRSPAVNVQVNAALGLGLLGRERVGAGLAALHGARTGGDARTREAVRRALDMIEPRGPDRPEAGHDRRLRGSRSLVGGGAREAQGRRSSAVGVADSDRPTCRTAATSCARTRPRRSARSARRRPARRARSACGCATTPPRVRLAAAQALDKLGDAAVVETADDLVGALRDSDDKVAAGVRRGAPRAQGQA